MDDEFKIKISEEAFDICFDMSYGDIGYVEVSNIIQRLCIEYHIKELERLDP